MPYSLPKKYKEATFIHLDHSLPLFSVQRSSPPTPLQPLPPPPPSLVVGVDISCSSSHFRREKFKKMETTRRRERRVSSVSSSSSSYSSFASSAPPPPGSLGLAASISFSLLFLGSGSRGKRGGERRLSTFGRLLSVCASVRLFVTLSRRLYARFPFAVLGILR